MGARGGGGRKMAAAGGTARPAAAAPARLPCSAWLLAAAAAAALTAVKVSAVEVNTPEEIFVENGTDAKLPCTFTSVEVISSAASVSWSFQPEGAATRISFFYYFNGKPYPGKDIPFKDRITWAGDLNKKDASISISNMQFRDNGTYICDVKNPPDIVVKPGEIRVRVVEKDLHAGFPIGGASGQENLTVSEGNLVFGNTSRHQKNAATIVFKLLKTGFQAIAVMLSCILTSPENTALVIGCNSS